MADNQIRLIRHEGEYVIDSRIVSEGLQVQHKNSKELIRKYEAQFERFGPLTFETLPDSIGLGMSQSSYYLLNENQVYLLGTLCRNTDKAVDFKVALVAAFSEARQALQQEYHVDNAFPDTPITRAAKEMEAVAKHDLPKDQADFLYNSIQDQLADEMYPTPEGRFLTVKDVKRILKLDQRYPRLVAHLSTRLQPILDVLALSARTMPCCGVKEYELTDEHLKLVYALTMLPDWHVRSARQLVMPYQQLDPASCTQLQMFGAYPNFN